MSKKLNDVGGYLLAIGMFGFVITTIIGVVSQHIVGADFYNCSGIVNLAT